jgi:hypothetical protein
MEAAKLMDLAMKLRRVEDCLRRALDQLEADEPDKAAWRYVNLQVNKASEYNLDAIHAVLLSPGFIE